MLTLREVQLRFAAALFEGALEPLAPHIRPAGLEAAAARLAIYRTNLHEGFRQTLALEFPVIERLVGARYFRQLAREFLTAHPSRAGNLHHIGAPFAPFLRARFAHSPYAYFADVAALEWAYQEALGAPEAPPLDPQRLRAIAPQRYGALRFALQPACRLVHSPYPIVRIWHANQPEAPAEHPPIDLDSGGDAVLVRRRPDHRIELQRMPPGPFALLQALHHGASLGDALDAAEAAHRAASLADEAPFDLATALRRFVALGVFVDVSDPIACQLELDHETSHQSR